MLPEMSRPFACRCTVSIRYAPVGSIKRSASHRFGDQNIVASCAMVTATWCAEELNRQPLPYSCPLARNSRADGGDGEDGNGMPLSYVYERTLNRISVSQLKLTVDEAHRIARLISRLPSENAGARGRVTPYPIDRQLARKALAISAKPKRKAPA